jgi:DNA-binding response OmpR family regulator
MAAILVVEDEVDLCNLIRTKLEAEGHSVLQAFDGPAALRMVEVYRPHLVILDWMLPGLDGLAVCRQLRQAYLMPIIMLTARNEEIDRVLGLEVGADDYISKPFSVRELLARVRAMLRRVELDSRSSSPVANLTNREAQSLIPAANDATASSKAQAVGKEVFIAPSQDASPPHPGGAKELRHASLRAPTENVSAGEQASLPTTSAPIVRGALRIYELERVVTLDEVELDLTPKEYELLVLLASHPGRAFSREFLLQHLWGYDYDGFDRTVDTHMTRLRKKLGTVGEQIVTVWGVGYRFVV